VRNSILVVFVAAFWCALEGSAAAQGSFIASLGQAYGGSAQSSAGLYALALAGGGAHSIGSELEFSQIRHFTDLTGTERRILTLMASVSVSVPIDAVRPYGIFGYGFIRQRTDDSTGSALSNLSNNDVGYNVGMGVTLKFAKHAGVRADWRHFKVRTSAGLSYQRFMVGIVLGG
jgi:Outer membrane protein beta-barrel domain